MSAAIKTNNVTEVPSGEVHPLRAPKNHKRRFSCSRYLAVTDHANLFELGSFYSKQMQDQKKFFSFYCALASDALRETIINLSAFINYHHEKKVTVLVNNFDQRWIKTLNLSEEEIGVMNLNCYYAEDGIEVIDLKALKKFCEDKKQDYESIVKQIQEESEILLWDLSEYERYENEKNIFFTLWNEMDGVSVVVEKEKTRTRALNPFMSLCRKSEKEVLNFLIF